MLAYSKILENAHKAAECSYFMYSRIIEPKGHYKNTKNIRIIKDKLNMHQLVIDGTIPIENIIHNSKHLYVNDEANTKSMRTSAYLEDNKPYVTMYYYLANVTIGDGTGETPENYVIDCVFYGMPAIYQIPSIITKSIALMNIISRHMNLYNNYLQSDNDIYMERMDKFNTAISKQVLYDLGSKFSRCEPSSIGMLTRIHDYQINNLNFMINREEIGLEEIFVNGKLLVFENGLLFNYNNGKFINIGDIPRIRIKGGVIADDPGIGKTLQLLTLCWLRQTPTAIVVPDHLYSAGHWELEICKHFVEPSEFHKFVEIYSFTMFSSLNKDHINRFRRIIVDEAHEVYAPNSEDTDITKKMKVALFNNLTSTKCDYKWLITGTPFASGADSMFKIISLLIDDKCADSPIKFTYETFIRNLIYDPTLELIFRRNIKENVVEELHLPDISYNNVILQFSEFEQQLYDTEMSANVSSEFIDPTQRISRNIDIELLRKICSNVMIGCSSGDNANNVHVSVSQVRALFLDKFRTMYESQLEILNSYNKMVLQYYAVYQEILAAIQKGLPVNINEITRRVQADQAISVRRHHQLTQLDEHHNEFSNPMLDEIKHNIKHYEDLVTSQKKVVESRLTVFKRYEKIVSVIEDAAKRFKVDESADSGEAIDYDKACPICADSLKNVIALYECGHFFCKVCSDIWRKTNKKCVCCRVETPDEKITIIQNDNMSAYGTKISYIIDLLKQSPPDEQFVIFTQFESSIQYMVSILNKEGVTSSVYTNWFSIKDFKENSKKAIILSSANQPSGLDLSFVSNIIMIEPLNGEFSFRRDIEKQIISRIHRIKQQKDINVYRLIIKNTIEEQLYVDL